MTSKARRRTTGARIAGVARHLGIALTAAVFLFPFFWMLSNALRPDREIFAMPPRLLPSAIQWYNFVAAWRYLPFGRFFLNSAFVAASVTVIVLVVSSLSGYAFARLKFPGRGGLFIVYLATLMVPQAVIVIPLFLMMGAFDWVDTYQGLIVPVAFSSFGTFLLRQFFLTIPIELEEAAKIDGAGHIRILRSIIVPIAAPAFAVLAVFTFIAYWNSFLWPLIIISDTNRMTVPLGLQLFLGQQGQRWELLMAAATISMVPTVILVIALQKYLVRGIALSGLGGR
jgi:multiple sugar transport system permease protein